jgi:hypothetical protein
MTDTRAQTTALVTVALTVVAAVFVPFWVAPDVGALSTSDRDAFTLGPEDAGDAPLPSSRRETTGVSDAFEQSIKARVEAADSTEALRAIGAFEAHAHGVTGEGVTVGIVGRAFDTDSPAVDGQVVERRRFGDRQAVDRRTAHGTAVAEIVTETAPDANIYLAGVGSRPTTGDYADAVEWLVERDVDVVVDAGSYFPRTEVAAARLSATAEEAIDSGVIYVTSAGNYAGHHWAGRGTRSGWVNFSADRQGNPLGAGRPVGGTVSVRLQWDSTADYDLYLYRRVAGEPDPVVAKSTRRAAGGMEAIDVSVPRGHYYVSVYAHEGVPDPGDVQVFSALHSLGFTNARGSLVAPASGEGVITVGAVDGDGEYRSYSSLSDAGDVDVAAPDGVLTRSAGEFTGTSAATPYVGGVAALLASEADLTPAEAERLLERTSAGGTSVDAYAAVEAIPGATVDPQTGASVDEAESAGRADDGDESVDGDRSGSSGDANGTWTAPPPDSADGDSADGDQSDGDSTDSRSSETPASGGDSEGRETAGDEWVTDDEAGDAPP